MTGSQSNDQSFRPMGSSKRQQINLLHTVSEPVLNTRVRTQRPLMDAFRATRPQDPAMRFGMSIRESINMDNGAPGPGTYNLKAVTANKTMDSRIRSSSHFSIRGREKFGDPMLKAIDATTQLEPGPGHYRPRQVNPRERNAPQYSFPKQVPPRDKKKMAPGPGEYQMPASVGKQVLSTTRNNMAPSFGSGNRPPLLMMSSEVGPGQYKTGPSSYEGQLDSRKRTGARVKFGTGGRHKADDSLHAESPGPGDYQLAPALGGGGPTYIYRSAPKCSMSGRNKFGSPFS